jgi:hypothetical protein
MFELLIGIDGVQRRMGERAEKTRRGDDGERRSRLRSALAIAWSGAGSARSAARRALDSSPRSGAADCH